MYCPNHTREKRPSRGGGQVGCSQHVTLTLLVPITIRVKRGGLRRADMPLEDMIPTYTLKHGVRVKPAELARAFRGTQSMRPRIGCGCGWSLEQMMVPRAKKGREVDPKYGILKPADSVPHLLSRLLPPPPPARKGKKKRKNFRTANGGA